MNRTQRNNVNKPLETCNVTSYAMWLDYMGYGDILREKLNIDEKTIQLEDYLYNI
jgi:hypothetical protein